MRKLSLLAVILSAFTAIYAGSARPALSAIDQNRPVIIMAGFGNTPFTFSSVNGGRFEIIALIRGGVGAIRVEAFLDLRTPSGEAESRRFGLLDDPEGDGIYILVIEGLPALAVPSGEFTGIRLLATDSRGNRAIWPALDVPLASSPLEDIDVEPPLANLAAPGETVQLTVTGRFEDGSRADITSSITGTTYTSTDTDVATVGPDGLLTAVGDGTALIIMQNGPFSDVAGVRVGLERPRLVSISVVGPSTFNFTAPGQTEQLAVSGNFSDGSARDIARGSSGTTYESSDETVAAVSPDGLISAVGGGTAIITIRNAGLFDIAGVTVRSSAQSATGEPPRLISIAVEGSPEIALAEPGATRQLAIAGQLSDGSSSDLTAASTGTFYSSSDPSIVTVSADGLLAAQSPGSATVTATNGELRATVAVTVSRPQPTLTSIQVAEGSTISLDEIGQTHQLRVTGFFSDGSTREIAPASSGTIYSSSDTAVATVSSDGLITAAGLGTAIITIRNGSSSDVAGVIVGANRPRVTLISVEPNSSFALTSIGQTSQLRIMGRLEDGSTIDITSASSGTTYSSSNPAIVAVSADGLVTASGPGSTSIFIRNGSASNVANVTVRTGGASLLSLSIAPSSLSFNGVAQSASLSVQGNYSDGRALDLTSPSMGTTYSSSDEAVARVDPAGNVTAVNRGTASITALNSSVSASITVTVSF